MSSDSWQQDIYDVIKSSGIQLIGYVPDAGHDSLINNAKSGSDMHGVREAGD